MNLLYHPIKTSESHLNPIIEMGYSAFKKQSVTLASPQDFKKRSFGYYTFTQINKDTLSSVNRERSPENFKKRSFDRQLEKPNKDKFSLKKVERSPPCMS